MKVLLIDPPGIGGNLIGRILGSFGTNKADQLWPPYDLQAIAGYCRQKGYGFKILDANNLRLSWEDIKNSIKSYSPDWVVYLTCFQTFLVDAEVANLAKQVNDIIKTCCISLSMYSVEKPEEKLNDIKSLDYIVWGEAEIPLMKLFAGEQNSRIAGLYYRENSKVYFTGAAPQLENLDDFGIPVHYGLPTRIYRCPLAMRKPITIVNCSRGCVNNCIHCQAGNFQKPLRYRSVNNVLKELEEIRSLGLREIKFYDCSLPTNQKFINELCDAMIENKFNFSWNCNSRADKINPDILIKMKKAGCHTICLGAESAHPHMLKNMNKNETPEQIEHASKLIKKYGLRLFLYTIFGLPGETKETMNYAYHFVRRIEPDFATFGIVVPAPGTPFYRFLKENNYLVKKELAGNDPNALPSFNYPGLSAKEILDFSRLSYRKFYFNSGYILRRLARIRSFHEFYMISTSALSVIRRYAFGSPCNCAGILAKKERD